MTKNRRIAFVIISSIIQLVFVPIAYKIFHSIAKEVHQSHIRHGGIGMNFYNLMVLYLWWFLAFAFIIVNTIYEIYKSELLASSIHISMFAFIVWFTYGDLQYMPYTHGLLLFCVGLTIPLRILLRKKLYILICR